MNKKLIALSISTILLIVPAYSFAVALLPIPGVITAISPAFDAFFGIIWMFFAAFAVIAFLIAGFLFLSANGNASKVAQARDAVIWGIVGVAVGLLAFSIPFIVKSGLGI